MSVSVTSPATGAPQTGLTTPTYTLVEDTPPNSHSVQYAVTVNGGTQSGVEVHKVSEPFTLTIERPAQLRAVGVPNPTTGVISNVPNNVYKLRVRKGVQVDASGDNFRVAMAEMKISVPAGSDINAKANVRAMLSLIFGVGWDSSQDFGQLIVDGIL